MKKIDIHMHVSEGRMQNHLGTGSAFMIAEEILQKYEMLGIDKGVLLPRVNPEYALDVQSNASVMAVIDKYPDRFYWFCNIDPRMGDNTPESDLSYFIGYYKKLGAKGVGEICANMYFDDPYVENLFLHCQNNRMPVIFHIGPKKGGYYGLVDEPGLYRLEKELQKFPDLIFIGHSQPFWAEMCADVTEENRNTYPDGKVTPGRVIELMRKYSNLYGDLSAGSGFNAVKRDPEFGYHFIEEFQDRLFFGTDICAPDEDIWLSFWLDNALDEGKISHTAYHKVCRQNALKLLEG